MIKKIASNNNNSNIITGAPKNNNTLINSGLFYGTCWKQRKEKEKNVEKQTSHTSVSSCLRMSMSEDGKITESLASILSESEAEENRQITKWLASIPPECKSEYKEIINLAKKKAILKILKRSRDIMNSGGARLVEMENALDELIEILLEESEEEKKNLKELEHLLEKHEKEK